MGVLKFMELNKYIALKSLTPCELGPNFNLYIEVRLEGEKDRKSTLALICENYKCSVDAYKTIKHEAGTGPLPYLGVWLRNLNYSFYTLNVDWYTKNWGECKSRYLVGVDVYSLDYTQPAGTGTKRVKARYYFDSYGEKSPNILLYANKWAYTKKDKEKEREERKKAEAEIEDKLPLKYLLLCSEVCALFSEHSGN